METKATNSPVKLRVTSLCTCKHNVENEKGKKNTEHSDELQHRSCVNVSVVLLLCRLNQRGEHNTDAKKIADVCEMYVEIPTNGVDVVKDSKTCDTSYKPKGAINCVELQV